MFITSCNIDSTNYKTDDRNLYIDSVIVEASKNNFLEKNIKASIINYSKTISASLPSQAKDKKIVSSIYDRATKWEAQNKPLFTE